MIAHRAPPRLTNGLHPRRPAPRAPPTMRLLRGRVIGMAVRDGAAYLAGLRDGREIWIDGERVRDVTADPRLGRGAHAIAALFDLQCRADLLDEMTYPSPTTGERVSLSFVEPRSVDDLVRRRRMFKRWADESGGMLGRSPDFLRAVLTGLAINRAY